MNLVIDLGNTRIKFAVFDTNDQIVFIGKMLKRYASSLMTKLPSEIKIDNAILCNTSLPDEKLLKSVYTLENFIHFDSKTKLPIHNLYETPDTLGKDRLAAAVASYHRFRGSNVLFIDMGTCITMNLINAKGEFIGGNISPGIQMRLKAMHHYTAKLPLVKAALNEIDFGASTVKALQNGAVKGAFREIDSFIDETRLNFGSINVILTGGDAFFFESWTKKEIFVAPNLVMEGLNEILKYNVKNK